MKLTQQALSHMTRHEVVAAFWKDSLRRNARNLDSIPLSVQIAFHNNWRHVLESWVRDLPVK